MSCVTQPPSCSYSYRLTKTWNIFSITAISTLFSATFRDKALLQVTLTELMTIRTTTRIIDRRFVPNWRYKLVYIMLIDKTYEVPWDRGLKSVVIVLWDHSNYWSGLHCRLGAWWLRSAYLTTVSCLVLGVNYPDRRSWSIPPTPYRRYNHTSLVN